MRKIVLMCANGMSTGMLMNKMREAAKQACYDCEISAYPVSMASTVGAAADCILIGPQVRFEKDSVRAECPNVPVKVIEMTDYGRLDGAKVLAMAKQMMSDA